jgi:hypothetical protein
MSDFAKNFNGPPIPSELVKLLDFQNNIADNDVYSHGFGLIARGEEHGLAIISKTGNSLIHF